MVFACSLIKLLPYTLAQLCLKKVTSGVARIWCQGARRSRRRKREHRGAKGAEWGGVWGGVTAPQPTTGLGERCELPQRGPGHSPGRYRIFCIS